MTWKYFKGKENLTNKLLSQGMKLATTLVRPLLGRQLHNLVQRNSIGISPRRPRGGAVYASGESVNLVVIGDSTVNGSGISCRSLTLGGQLAKALSARTRRTVHWTVMAAGGITPARVHDKYLPKLPAQNPDVVVIGLGETASSNYPHLVNGQRPLQRSSMESAGWSAAFQSSSLPCRR